MTSDIEAKTDQYESLLAEALAEAEPVASGDTEGKANGEECMEMATSYLEDGRHFLAEDDPVNALAAFSYGHGWLDAGARVGVLDVPTEGHLFTV